MTSSTYRRLPSNSSSESEDSGNEDRKPFNIDKDKINDTKEIRIILVGKTGVGKSATGNTILGEPEFNSEIGGSSVTQKGDIKMMKWKKKIVHVIDTPGFFDTEITEDKVLTEIIRSCGMVSPGPHVILYVMTIRHRFTNEDARCVDEFVNLFAGNPYKHTIICFTDKDALDHKGKNTIVYLRDVPEPLRNLLKKCGNRTVFFNNISGNTKHQWIELYSVIDKMLKQNNDSFFSNEILVEVEKALVQKMKEDNDPSKVKRLIYKTKRDMANDGSTMSYLKTTLLASGSCGTLMGITVLAGSLIVGHGLVAALVAAKTATFLGSVVGGTVFFAGKMITRTVTTHCSIS